MPHTEARSHSPQTSSRPARTPSLRLLALASAAGMALTWLPAPALAQPPANPFDMMEKQKMRWNLAYKMKRGDVTKYQIDSIASTKVSSWNVAEAGSESEFNESKTTRVYLTQKVVDVDDQQVTTLEFTYDNMVAQVNEVALDTSGAIGRKFLVRISSKGNVVDIEGSGDTSGFAETVADLFLKLPDQTVKIGDSWNEQVESCQTDPSSGLQTAQTVAKKFTVKDFEEFQRRDCVVLNQIDELDQELGVRTETPGQVTVQTVGQGSGSGTTKGTVRLDGKTGQLVTREQTTELRNTMTVTEHQLVGPSVRTKYITEVSATVTVRIL